ncbi:hypothetical protein EIN_186310 [Entamoeba invadens IP1]|uniref:hypothetical protein n=1 Tax=Entamoeba invadens IP1 TaxID=370355 RepID=UPI0002C3E156|nr:hypothetical protein EIN_186310 [Entamoeba invadens IP1]ELP94204.1 hypothetical protein EIN_186310 [Entamoeba invadens IP1]|eukprot:XP_004260975.1 hypothetical protein EIN_186310 [Entamoeba invadens IP1]
MSYKPNERLCKKAFWEECYKTELKNFSDNPSDVGEVWFGEQIAEQVVDTLQNYASTNLRVLDVGCGCGYTLLLLFQAGYTRLYGVDYCEGSVELTKKVLTENNVDMDDVIVEKLDLLDEYCIDTSEIKEADVIIDKGTFDAIMVAPEKTENAGKYKRYISQVLAEGGIFVITSCNWTEDELVDWLGNGLDVIDQIKEGSYSFGGSQGSKTTTLFFRKI